MIILGIGLMLAAVIALEVASSMSKDEYQQHELGPWSLAYMYLAIGVVIFFIIALARDGSIDIATASLPYMIPRGILDVLLIYVTVKAIGQAPRTSYTFIHSLTVPALLIVDLVLGYSITTGQFAGIIIMGAAMSYLAMQHGISRKGLALSLASTGIAVVTLSLFKHSVENFNHVADEQFVVHVFVIAIFAIVAWVREGNHPLFFLFRKKFCVQAILAGISQPLASFAISLAPVSIMIAIKRGGGAAASIASGKYHFHEKKIGVKIVGVVLLVLGVVAMGL